MKQIVLPKRSSGHLIANRDWLSNGHWLLPRERVVTGAELNETAEASFGDEVLGGVLRARDLVPEFIFDGGRFLADAEAIAEKVKRLEGYAALVESWERSPAFSTVSTGLTVEGPSGAGVILYDERTRTAVSFAVHYRDLILQARGVYFSAAYSGEVSAAKGPEVGGALLLDFDEGVAGLLMPLVTTLSAPLSAAIQRLYEESPR